MALPGIPINMVIITVLLCALAAAGAAEDALHRRRLEAIPLRILVNGTRGKTSVTRLAAAALNEGGIRTYAKTTGSDARWVLPDGQDIPYRKRRLVNMMEHLSFIRFARKGGAEAVVVECMALRPENQRLTAQKLMRQHYTLITNAYPDHLEEIGKTPEETAHTLSLSIAPGSRVITGDTRFGGEQCMLPAQGEWQTLAGQFDYHMHEENLALVLALTDQLGIPRETAVRGMFKARPDIGMLGPFRAGKCLVVNGFSANDPTNFASLLNACGERGDYLLLFNHREDRGYRLDTFAQTLRQARRPPAAIAVIGSNKAWAARYLHKKCGIEARPVAKPEAWLYSPQPQTLGQVLCAGNIRGEGKSLIEKLKGPDQKNG